MPRQSACLHCGKPRSETPVMRSGPGGTGTLCNSCGLQFKIKGQLPDLDSPRKNRGGRITHQYKSNRKLTPPPHSRHHHHTTTTTSLGNSNNNKNVDPRPSSSTDGSNPLVVVLNTSPAPNYNNISTTNGHGPATNLLNTVTGLNNTNNIPTRPASDDLLETKQLINRAQRDLVFQEFRAWLHGRSALTGRHLKNCTALDIQLYLNTYWIRTHGGEVVMNKNNNDSSNTVSWPSPQSVRRVFEHLKCGFTGIGRVGRWVKGDIRTNPCDFASGEDVERNYIRQLVAWSESHAYVGVGGGY